MALALTSYPTAVGAWLWAGVGSIPLCLAALLKTLHESPGDGTFPSLVRELHCMCYHSLEGAMGCWCMALSGGVLSLGVVLRPALQGGSRVLHLSLGSNSFIPSRAILGFGQPHVPTRHPSPRTAQLAAPAEATYSSQWMGACPVCWDSRRAVGQGKGRWHLPGVCSPRLLS